MATEEVGVKVTVEGDGQAAKSVGNIKKELREAQAAALQLSRDFGELSPEAIAAAKKVTALKDEVADLSERVALFDPGAKFAVLGNVAKSVAGGFTAAQGAMALFGAESEDLTKQIAKLQGAMALTEGLSTITDSWKDFQRLGAVIKGPIISAFTSLKGAIAATGLGLLAIVVGTIVANFQEIKAAILDVFPALGNLGKIVDMAKASLSGFFDATMSIFKTIGTTLVKFFTGDFAGAVEAAKGLGERAGAAYRKGFEDKAMEIKLEKLAAKRREQAEDLERELTKIEAEEGKKRYDLRLQLNQKMQDALTSEGKWDSKELADNLAERSNLLREQRDAEAKAAKEAADKIKEAGEKALQALQAQQTLEFRTAEISGKDVFNLRQTQLAAQLDLVKKYGLDLSSIQQQQANEELDRRKKLNDQLQKEVTGHNTKMLTTLVNVGGAQADLQKKQVASQEDTKKKTEESEAAKQLAYEQTARYVQFVAEATREGSEIEQAAAFAGALAVKISEDGKISAMEATKAALDLGAKMLGETTAAGKAVAIASTTINTYESAMLAYRNGQMVGGPWGIALGVIAAAAAVAAGISNVRKIMSVKVPGGKSVGGGSGPSNTSVSAPLTPQVQASNNTIVDQMAQMNSNLNQPNRVFVLESDITDKQTRVASIEENATF